MNQSIILVNDYCLGGGAEVMVDMQKNIYKQEFDLIEYYGKREFKSSTNPLSYIFSLVHFFKFLKLLFFKKPDFVHLNNYYHILSPSILLAVWVYKKFFELKIIFTAHDFHIVSPNPNYYYFSNGDISKFDSLPSIKDVVCKKFDNRNFGIDLLKKAQWVFSYRILRLQKVFDIIITPTAFVKEILSTEKKLNCKIKVVRNPYDGPSMIKTQAKNNLFKIVFVGRLSFDKGLHLFIKALNKLNGLNFTFDIIGTGDELAKLQRLVKEFNLDESIKFLGHKNRDYLYAKLNSYDALVNPSLCYETSSLVCVEAALNGLKLLVPNYGGIKETAEILGDVTFFEPTNLDSITRAIYTSYDLVPKFRDQEHLQKIGKIYSQEVFKETIIKILKVEK